MKGRLNWLFKPLSLFMVLGVLTLTGCSGDDGTNGLNGKNGVDGTNGTDGAPAVSAALAVLPQATITADSAKANTADPAHPTVSVTFTASNASMYAGGVDAINPTNTSRLLYLRIAWAQLAAPAAGSGDTAQWVRLSSGDRDAADLKKNANGSFTMTTPVSANDFDASRPTRVLIMLAGVTDQAAPLNVIHNFVPNGAAANASRDLVSEGACNSCHANEDGQFGFRTTDGGYVHGGSRYVVAACVVCHTDKANSADASGVSTGRVFQTLIHQIHAEINGASDNWAEEVTYPGNILNCTKCHTGVANADNWKTTPTMQACTTCHTTADLTGGTSFVGLDGVTKTHQAQANNANCALCHVGAGAFGGDIATIHSPVLTGNQASEFNVTISMTAPANGTYYDPAVDAAPVVTVTLADSATNTPVAGTIYTTDTTDASSAVGVAGGGLSSASLFVYGPRSNAVPVLTTGSTTDTVNGTTPPTQGHSLLLTGGVNADPQVTTDTNGYSYQLMDNLANLTPGTYMVRFEGSDYGGVSAADWVTSSSKAITFQVGTATVEPKVSGDGCLNCHGNNIMHLEGTHAHHAPFDTDYCLACHDKSGNHGDYIGNRVHAVHGATVAGDLAIDTATPPGTLPRDWEDISFPQAVNNCAICHTNPNAETPVWQILDVEACAGCHGQPLADPNNPAFYVDHVTGLPLDPVADATEIAEIKAKLTAEAGAAQHMVQNGGDFTLTTPSLQCNVCHGAGRIADLYVTHKLVTFPPVDTGE